MTEGLLIGLAGIIVMGVSAQWLAWRVKIPSILLLLVFGIVAGPVTGFLDTDEIFGDMLFPVVSLSVAVILFEGGLSLKLSELRKTGGIVHRLLTLGTMLTWLMSALAAHYILGLDYSLALLLGAILVVTGPTVIIPLLRQVNPTDRVASVLRWEGILTDPVGAVLAVLVYEAVVSGTVHHMPTLALIGMAKTVLIAGAVGVTGAALMIFFLKRYWIPDFLQNPVALMLVLAAYTASDVMLAESGLLAVTVMGAVLANQSKVAVKHIAQFKEDLGVLIISGLFIILAARLRPEDIHEINFWSILFLVVLIVVIRPVSVFVSTLFTGLTTKEKAFISLLAPRGIVAAAVVSVFALRLVDAGNPQAAELLPLTFLVIIGTVAFYGIGSPFFARKLEVAQPNPQGVLILGAQSWAIKMAAMLKDSGFKVLLMDTNRANVVTARMQGIPVYYGSGLTEATFSETDLTGIGRLLAMTPNNSVNSLAALHFESVFDSSELYQLPPKEGEDNQKKAAREGVSKHLRGRYLFSKEATYGYLARRFALGAVLKKTKLSEEFNYRAFLDHYGPKTLPLFLITETRNLVAFSVEKPPTPKPGQTVVALVEPTAEKAEKEKGKAEAEKREPRPREKLP